MSFDRWITDTTSTAAMPKATDSATKIRIRVFEVFCACTAVKNCALVAIQLSASTSFAALMRWAIVFGRIDVLDRRLDGRDAADHADQGLRGAQRDVGVALVDALVAEIEDSDDS